MNLVEVQFNPLNGHHSELQPTLEVPVRELKMRREF
jgi:hypothetical protein